MIKARKSVTPQERAVIFAKAWEWCWENRYEGEAYLSATDLHNRVRSALLEILEGKTYGEFKNHGSWYSGLRATGFSLQDCRTWLFNQVRRGVLRADNPSQKGTCTGLRFRPAGNDLTEAEKKTAAVPREEKARQRFIRHLKGADNRPACMANTPRRPGGSFRRQPFRYTSENCPEPTCKRCAKLAVEKTAYIDPNLGGPGDLYLVPKDDVPSGVFSSVEEATKAAQADGYRVITQDEANRIW